MKKFNLTIALAVLLAGCGTTNSALVNRTSVVEYYRIFDINTEADRYAVADAASKGLGRNVGSINEERPIPQSAELPEAPGRFRLDNPLEGTNLGLLAAGSGNSSRLKIASCDGAVWIARARRSTRGSSDLRLTACIWEYKQGFHLDIYATFEKQEGGLMQVSRNMAHAMVGTPEEWTEKTFNDIVRTVQKDTGAEIEYIEGYPRVEGMPWLDDYDRI